MPLMYHQQCDVVWCSWVVECPHFPYFCPRPWNTTPTDPSSRSGRARSRTGAGRPPGRSGRPSDSGRFPGRPARGLAARRPIKGLAARRTSGSSVMQPAFAVVMLTLGVRRRVFAALRFVPLAPGGVAAMSCRAPQTSVPSRSASASGGRAGRKRIRYRPRCCAWRPGG